jgi:hypothetical protein
MEESFYIYLNEMVEQLKQKSIKGGLTWDKRGLVFYPSLSEIGGKKKWFLPTSMKPPPYMPLANHGGLAG